MVARFDLGDRLLRHCSLVAARQIALAVTVQSRRFPPPWTVEETAPCFIVRDHNGQALAFVYCEDEPGRRTTGKLLTRDEGRRIAANIAKPPELLGAEPKPDANALIHRR
jgi:hypothetical protein